MIALEFDPNRFLDERVQKYLTPNPFIFLPFNAGMSTNVIMDQFSPVIGPRLCLGQQFAYNQASYIITRLLQTFDTVALAPEAQPEGTRPPASWKLAPVNRRKRIEEFFPKSHVTMYSHVRTSFTHTLFSDISKSSFDRVASGSQ